MPSLIKLIKKTYKMARPLERKVVMRNVAALSLLQAISYALPIIIVPYLFRVLGAEKFGLIAFAQALVQYFCILTDYGFSITATKEISLCRNVHSKVCNAFSLVMATKITLAFLSFLALGIIVYFIPKFKSDWMVYVFSFGTVLGSTLFPVWFFQGTEKMKYITYLNVAGGIIFAVLIFTFVRQPKDYLLFPLINSCVSVSIGLLSQYIVFSKFGVQFNLKNYKNIRQQLRAGWDVFISIAAINAYTNTRVFILGLVTNNSITGFYAIAEKVANAFQTFPLDSFSQAIFPRLSRIFQKNKIRAFSLMSEIQKITTFISLIFLPLIFILAEVVVKLVCGEAYPEAVLSLRLLLVAVFFVAANAFRVQFLLVCGKTHIYSRIHVVAAIIGLPLMFLLISSFSFAGAATATIIIEVGIFFITFFTVKRMTFA